MLDALNVDHVLARQLAEALSLVEPRVPIAQIETDSA